MKQPNLSRLRIDRAATNKLRAELSKSKRVTITVNLDSDSLRALKTLSTKTGIPYQRLLRTLLAADAVQQETIHVRLNRLEQELRKIKRRVAA
jgi:predicted DNA binding CopG/RHH family protein